MSLWRRVLKVFHPPYGLAKIVLAATVVSVLVDFTLDLLAPADALSFTTSAKLVDVVLSSNEGDSTAALGPALPTELQRFSLPLGEGDVPGCPLDELGSATIDVTATDPKLPLRVGHIALRSAGGCHAFRLTTKRYPDGVGLLLSPRRPCGLLAAVELESEQSVQITVTYSQGTQAPAGCPREQTRTVRELAPRVLDPEMALVLYRADGAIRARDTQVKIAANALEGTAAEAGSLFGQAVENAESRCAYGRNMRLKVVGRIDISDFEVGADGLALQFHAKAHDVAVDDTRDCLREANGGVAPRRGPNRTIAIIRGITKSIRAMPGCSKE